MSFLKRDLLNHLKALRSVLLTRGAEAFLDPCTLVLRVRVGTVTHALYPQFLAFKDGTRQYSTRFEDGSKKFTGWCPYAHQRWPLASEKLLFKRFAVHNDISTPEYSADPLAVMDDVVVKKSASSFSADIKGPFKSSSEHKLDAQAGEYFERFVRGRIAKIWYCNDRPVCLEFEKMPTVKGNGVSTVRELVKRKLFRRGRKRRVEPLGLFLEYQGITLDTVLEKNQEQVVEFRYGSPLLTPDLGSDVDLIGNMIPSLEPQLRDIGHKLWRALADEVRPDTIFTVDAIVDEQERIWTLEMNSNPFIHPFVYPVMMEHLFAKKTRAAEVAPAA